MRSLVRLKKSKVISCMLLGLLFCGCDYFAVNKAAGEDPVARVGDVYLYPSDLEGMIAENASVADSAALVSSYVNNWVRQQLVIKKAQEELLDLNEAELERKVLEYRSSLIVHEYKREQIRKQLKEDISQEEIEAYYQDKVDNFLLKQNIVKCIFVKVPKKAPRINKFSRMLRSYPDADFDDIKAYCLKFADKYVLEDSLWINFDDIIQDTHLAGIPNKTQFLKSNRFMESTDNGFVYFLRILDYKISEETSPLSFIEGDIRNILINKRKVSISQDLEDKIFNEARSKNEFEIYKK